MFILDIKMETESLGFSFILGFFLFLAKKEVFWQKRTKKTIFKKFPHDTITLKYKIVTLKVIFGFI